MFGFFWGEGGGQAGCWGWARLGVCACLVVEAGICVSAVLPFAPLWCCSAGVGVGCLPAFGFPVWVGAQALIDKGGGAGGHTLQFVVCVCVGGAGHRWYPYGVCVRASRVRVAATRKQTVR